MNLSTLGFSGRVDTRYVLCATAATASTCYQILADEMSGGGSLRDVRRRFMTRYQEEVHDEMSGGDS